VDLHVQLGGHRVPWHFRGSADWRAWAGGRPWDGGRVATVHVASADDWDRLWPEFERSLALAGWPADELDVRSVMLAADTTVAAAACQAATEDGDTGEPDAVAAWPRSRQRAAVAIATAAHPLVLVALLAETAADAAGQVTRRQQEAEQFAEAVVKGDPAGRMATVLVLPVVGTRAGDGAFDFRYGTVPVDPAALIDASLRDAWAAYRHVRLWWEAGGQLTVADRLERATADDPATAGDDVAFERSLCRAAAALAEADPAAVAVANTDFVGKMDRPATGPRGSMIRRPSAELTPWVARLLLCRDPRHPHGPYLRSRLRCEPLAGLVLARCASLEAHLRAHHSPPRDSTLRHDLSTGLVDAREQHRRFVAGEAGSLRPHYPVGHPSPPDQVLEFATLGTWQRFASRSSAPIDRLRQLRNAMAHGHYCSWRAVDELRQLVNLLSG
jgi:hypothetical protein